MAKTPKLYRVSDKVAEQKKPPTCPLCAASQVLRETVPVGVKIDCKDPCCDFEYLHRFGDRSCGYTPPPPATMTEFGDPIRPRKAKPTKPPAAVGKRAECTVKGCTREQAVIRSGLCGTCIARWRTTQGRPGTGGITLEKWKEAGGPTLKQLQERLRCG